jgi:hypothetical protein
MKTRELVIPDAAQEDPKSIEMIRAWIAKEDLHCALNIGVWGEKEVISWGLFISDVARHVSDALSKGDRYKRHQILEKIRSVFNDELDEPTQETVGSFIE